MRRSGPKPEGSRLRRRVEAYERRLILEALRTTHYHQRRAAAALGVLPSTLCEKMKRLGIPSRRRLLAELAWLDDSGAEAPRAGIDSPGVEPRGPAADSAAGPEANGPPKATAS